MGPDRVTTGEISRLFAVEQWQARRAVDAIDPDKVERAGRYRLVSRQNLSLVEAELKRRGYLGEGRGPRGKRRGT